MIFADTVYLLALLSPHDKWHERARQISQSTRQRVVTTAWILLETANGLTATNSRQKVGPFIRDLQSANDVEVVPASQEWFERGLLLYSSRSDKQWSLTDCISFVVMAERGIADALTSDHHFEQAGFQILLKP